MHQKGKTQISNTFFDAILLIISTFMSIPRAIFTFTKQDYSINPNNLFFVLLDFLFRRWPTYFWKKPTGLKLTSFFSDIFVDTFKK